MRRLARAWCFKIENVAIVLLPRHPHERDAHVTLILFDAHMTPCCIRLSCYHGGRRKRPLNFSLFCFEFVSDLVLRISDFPPSPGQQAQPIQNVIAQTFMAPTSSVSTARHRPKNTRFDRAAGYFVPARTPPWLAEGNTRPSAAGGGPRHLDIAGQPPAPGSPVFPVRRSFRSAATPPPQSAT